MTPTRSRTWLTLAAVALACTCAGWAELQFQCDDAFIAFRYARNAANGWGPTWNPPPFAPVEGYTSALWVALLATASLAGVPVPLAAEALSLGAGLATSLLAVAWLRRGEPTAGAPHVTLAGVALAGVVTNRTFLTWTSSGLETSLFNLLVVCWLYLATDRRLRAPALALTAALLALTRPDGLLYSAATIAILLGRQRPAIAVRSAAPLLLVAAHLAWRRSTYGAWLPNTYYAKVSDPWPEAGLRYLGSYLLEHGIWMAVPVILVACVTGGMARRLASSDLVRLGMPAAALLAHVGYYIFRVGGDHFEFRVLSHTVVPTFVALAWATDRVAGRRAPLLLLAIVAASWPLAWTHHLLGRDLRTRSETEALHLPVEPHLPPPLSYLAAANDQLQSWLIPRYIGRRHREHVVFRAYLEQSLAQPEELVRLDWSANRPIAAARSVGVVGWRFHEAAIIDELGLNDPVIARGPLRHADGSIRRMAHERRPPEGYLNCFRQNLIRDELGLLVDPTVPPMSDAEIQSCQTRFLSTD